MLKRGRHATMDRLYVSNVTGLMSIRAEDLPAFLKEIARRLRQGEKMVVLDVDGTLYSDRADAGVNESVVIQPDMPEALSALGDDWVFLTQGQAPHRGITDPEILGRDYRVPLHNTLESGLMRDAVRGLQDLGPDENNLPGVYVYAEDKPSVVLRLTRLLRLEYLTSQGDYRASVRMEEQCRWALDQYQRGVGHEMDPARGIRIMTTEIAYEIGRQREIKQRVAARPRVYFFDDNPATIDRAIRKFQANNVGAIWAIHVSPSVSSGRPVMPHQPRPRRTLGVRPSMRDYNDDDDDSPHSSYSRTPPETDYSISTPGALTFGDSDTEADD